MSKENLQNKTCKELRELAKGMNISGRWDMTKGQLIDAILGAEVLKKNDESESAKDECKIDNHDVVEVEDKVEKEYDELISELERNKNNDISSIKNEMDNLRKQISEIDSKIKTYNNSLKLIGENYDELISDYKQKLEELNNQNIIERFFFFIIIFYLIYSI